MAKPVDDADNDEEVLVQSYDATLPPPLPMTAFQLFCKQKEEKLNGPCLAKFGNITQDNFLATARHFYCGKLSHSQRERYIKMELRLQQITMLLEAMHQLKIGSTQRMDPSYMDNKAETNDHNHFSSMGGEAKIGKALR